MANAINKNRQSFGLSLRENDTTSIPRRKTPITTIVTVAAMTAKWSGSEAATPIPVAQMAVQTQKNRFARRNPNRLRQGDFTTVSDFGSASVIDPSD